MKTESMLAGVFASANEKLFAETGENGAAPSSGNQQTETPMADKTNAAADQPKTETVADLQATYPALCGQIASDAAKAERERITGILGLPAAGHGDLVSAAIADGKSTKAEVALGILEAEKATRSKVHQSLKDAGAEASVVNAAPNAGGSQGQHQAAVPATADGWAAEFAASPKLQSEFETREDYVAFKKAEAAGKIRVLRQK